MGGVKERHGELARRRGVAGRGGRGRDERVNTQWSTLRALRRPSGALDSAPARGIIVALAILTSFAISPSAAESAAPEILQSPPGEVVTSEGREIISLPAAPDGSARYLIKGETFALAEDVSLIPTPEGARGLPPGTLVTQYTFVGKSPYAPSAEILRPAELSTPEVRPAEGTETEFQYFGGGSNDKAGIHAESNGCDKYFLNFCTDSWDNRNVQGVYSSITYAVTTLNGDSGTAHWPGLVTASNDFIQIGFTNTAGNPGHLFVQVYRSGHFFDNCNTTYVTCNWYTVSPDFTVGQLYTFTIKSGADGIASKWSFDLGTQRVYSTTLGSSDSGANTAYSFQERVGTYPRQASFPTTYWDCGLCQYKSASWASPRHAKFVTEAFPSTQMCASHIHWQAEYHLGGGHGSCLSSGTRVW